MESNCCPVCYTEGIPFGTLGIRKHLRCRHCGIDFSYVSNDEPQAETASEDEILEMCNTYGKVLMFMNWAWEQPEGKNKSLGELLELGCQTFKLPHPPPKMEATLLGVAFRLAGQGVPFTTITA